MTLTNEKKSIGGVTRGALPWWLLHQKFEGKVLVVMSEEEDVMSFVDDFNSLFRLPSQFFSLPPVGVRGYPMHDEPHRQVSLFEWLHGKSQFIVTSKDGLKTLCDTSRDIRNRSQMIRPGFTMPRHHFEEILGKSSYTRAERTEQIGEYSIRGDVIDVWPPDQERPIRLTWNFDELEAIRAIDVYTQRSETYKTELRLYPVSAGESSTLVEVAPEDCTIISFSSIVEADWKNRSVIHVTPEVTSDNQGFEPPPPFAGQMERLRDQLIQWHDEDWRVVVFCHNQGERDRLEELLEDRQFSARGKHPPWFPKLVIGELEHGFLEPGLQRAVLANSEIFGRYRKRVRLPKFSSGSPLASPLDIHNNDFLVHEKHGIGRYVGLQSLTVKKVTSEFMALEYKGGDKLYVPIFELQQVQKYMGAEGRRPALSSLDTAAWERIKSKVKEDVAKLAADLLRQAAKRIARPGYAFPPPSHLEEEFGNSFIYDLTADQKKTLDDVQRDMQSTKAMDRLICGDVGYGKTEIAMRAAMKAALSGKQVCFLCPTTILAEQHYRNFVDRLADYPNTIVLLSRFQSKAEQKKILEKVTKGSADIIIGTHRLLSKDVSFKDLGLLIIDEEHRFGVKQKNRLLSLRETVDVLSLTATPIPRTLASSLGGIKDLSIIESPPEGRLPISTHVGLFDEDLMVKAVQEEMDRGGQVFYVHNRVKTLLARKQWLQEIMPTIRIAMVHGQMKEAELETAMHDFLHKKVDLLLATTIIESGLDIPSVNTLVVEEAEEMGLAQLYQLRGRVGRSRRRAYCYLFYNSYSMSTDAKKRLEALKEFTALGSGFRLAMRDMEIRGAGNLLGSQQHGNMAAVGLETFSRLLNEEIHNIKGEDVDDQSQGPTLELSLSSYIPDDYVPSESERIQMYKRVLAAKKEELAKLKEEFVDRCGPLPEPAKTLFDTASLRLLLKAKGVSEVHQEADALLIYFKPSVVLPESSFQILLSQTENVLKLIPGQPPGVRFLMKKDEFVLDTLGRFLRLVFLDSV